MASDGSCNTQPVWDAALLLGAFEALRRQSERARLMVRGIRWFQPGARLSLGTFQVGGASATLAASFQDLTLGECEDVGWSMNRLPEIARMWTKGRIEL